MRLYLYLYQRDASTHICAEEKYKIKLLDKEENPSNMHADIDDSIHHAVMTILNICWKCDLVWKNITFLLFVLLFTSWGTTNLLLLKVYFQRGRSVDRSRCLRIKYETAEVLAWKVFNFNVKVGPLWSFNIVLVQLWLS